MYSPPSVLVKFVTVSFLLFKDKLILGLSLDVIANPSLVHEKVGAGLPVALHEKVTFDPSFFALLSGFLMKTGRSVCCKRTHVLLNDLH